MPKKKAEGSTSDNWRKRMHMIDLSHRQEKEALAFVEGQGKDIAGALTRCIEAGWKVSASYSEYWGEYQANGTGGEDQGEASGHTFSVRYGTVTGALWILMYLLAVEFETGQLYSTQPKLQKGFLDDLL